MRRQLLYFILLVFGLGNAQIVHIPDANFKNTLTDPNIKSDSKIKSVELYDLTGILIKVNLGNSSEINQNLSAQPKGIYILKVYTK